MIVYLLATLDTKGAEAAFVRDQLTAAGVPVRLVDVGCQGLASVVADIGRERVFTAAGVSLADFVAASDRGRSVAALCDGAAKLIAEHYAQGQISGVIALGGSAGTAIGTAAMRALPLGVPKLMVSTLASGQVRQYVGDKDIMMVNTVVDLAGLNRISRAVLSNAAAAMAGMVQRRTAETCAHDRPLVAATMFGVTTPCVERARQMLDSAGYEVLVFHATGNGGRAMEALVREGLFAGVLDLTTTELADEVVGGFLSAGGERLTAAGACAVPQVVSVGATDMVNFYASSTVPPKFKRRKFYSHNPSVTLMRTTAEECAEIGADIGRKLASALGPSMVLLPRHGVSALDREGQPFDDPAARKSLFTALRKAAGNVPIVEIDAHINDEEFAVAGARSLIELMRQKAEGKK